MIPANVISWCTFVGPLIPSMSWGNLMCGQSLQMVFTVYTEVINFVVSPHMVALLDSFSMLVLE